MGKTLLTGATGFVGAQLAHALARRGDDLRVTVRERSRLDAIAELDVERVECDVLDTAAVARAVKGVDRVFHAAGVTSVRAQDAQRLYDVNVDGTLNVLDASLRAGVQRVLYVSSAAAIGPAHPDSTADERQLFQAGSLGVPYVDSVHRAEAEALRIGAKGLDVVCVNPTAVFGPGDFGVTSTRLVRSFLLGHIPAYADGGLNVVDVRDVAQGALLADAHGERGERYILGGRNFTFDRLFADLGRISGREPPLRVPRELAALAGMLPFAPGPSTLAPQEVLAASRFWTYSSAKAQRALEWKARPHEETLQATVDWYFEHEHGRIARERRSQQLQYRFAGALIAAGEDGASVGRRVLGGLGRLRR